MWLKQEVLSAAEQRQVRVFYLSQDIAKFWNQERDPDVPRVFTGWYWAVSRREAGPFHSRSAAWRDAWYAVVCERPPPRLANTADAVIARNQHKHAKTNPRRQQTASISSQRVA